MLTANLLPPQEKKELWIEETRRIIVFFALIISGLLIVSSSLLLPSFLPLVMQRRGLEDSLRVEEEASLRLEVKKKINSARAVAAGIKAIENYAALSSRPSHTLEEFLTKAGEGVAITFLNIKKDGEFGMIGRARTRRDLLRFEENLRESNKFEGLSSPLSNIIRETNINFSLQGKLKSMYRF